VAFLVTDAEELGLAGARAAARSLAPDVVLNLDGLDDEGSFLVLDRHDPLRRRRAPALAAAVRDAGARVGEAVRYRALPPGLLTDHIPFAEAASAVTIMRGRIRSLLRVHRPGDRADRLSGDGAARAVVLLEEVMRRRTDLDGAGPFTAPRTPTTFPGS
jgi:Zn-dependent M28 family amino/carboxypeptidase